MSPLCHSGTLKQMKSQSSDIAVREGSKYIENSVLNIKFSNIFQTHMY